MAMRKARHAAAFFVGENDGGLYNLYIIPFQKW